jgi:hypothetical protein
MLIDLARDVPRRRPETAATERRQRSGDLDDPIRGRRGRRSSDKRERNHQRHDADHRPGHSPNAPLARPSASGACPRDVPARWRSGRRYPPTSRPPPVTRRASAAKPPPSSHGARNSHTAMFAASRVVGPGRASQTANQNAPHTAEPARRGFHPRLRSVIQPVTAPASGATIVRSGTRSHTHSTASKSVTGSKGLARFHVARAPYLGL